MQKLNLKEVPDKFIYEEYFRRVRCYHYPERRIVLFGPPGSGKGTQAARLTNEICACHISTGDMLRREMTQGTEVGLKAKEIMNRGDLVPDDVVINMIQKKIRSKDCAKGVVFDGFPRTVEQAQRLDEMLEFNHKKIDKVFSFELDEKTLVER
jgi:adenylate kinase